MYIEAFGPFKLNLPPSPLPEEDLWSRAFTGSSRYILSGLCRCRSIINVGLRQCVRANERARCYGYSGYSGYSPYSQAIHVGLVGARDGESGLPAAAAAASFYPVA